MLYCQFLLTTLFFFCLFSSVFVLILFMYLLCKPAGTVVKEEGSAMTVYVCLLIFQLLLTL